jgi:hypothetical protein
VLARLLAFAPTPVELAEAEVAVGGDGALLELLGERERGICLVPGVQARRRGV